MKGTPERNPKTKDAVQVPLKKLPSFRCGKEVTWKSS